MSARKFSVTFKQIYIFGQNAVVFHSDPNPICLINRKDYFMGWWPALFSESHDATYAPVPQYIRTCHIFILL